MIISASRRTDIPAFYAEWLMNRIRAGFCHVPNPFNPKQVARVSLKPHDVDALVFWSKNPAPLLPHLAELDARGFRYYFLYTLNDYTRELEPGVPPLPERLATFATLAGHVGPERVIWRYDPIILSNRTDCRYHREAFRRLAAGLRGLTSRVIISVVDRYVKSDRRLQLLVSAGYRFVAEPLQHPEMGTLLTALKATAGEAGMSIQSCAEAKGWTTAAIPSGACIDAELLHRLWGLPLHRKDPGQRPACACAVSKDIGMNDTCLHHCAYCYATRSPATARARAARHDPTSPMLIGTAPDTDPQDFSQPLLEELTPPQP